MSIVQRLKVVKGTLLPCLQKKYSYDGIKFALLATILLCKCQCHYQLKHKCQILCFAEYKISKLSVNSPRMAEKNVHLELLSHSSLISILVLSLVVVYTL